MYVLEYFILFMVYIYIFMYYWFYLQDVLEKRKFCFVGWIFFGVIIVIMDEEGKF